MSKEKIAGNYIAGMKEIYKESFFSSMQRNILLTGYSKNNIGAEIFDQLQKDFPASIETPDEEVLDVRDLNSINSYLSNYDSFTDLICCHGFTHLDWIENQPDSCIDDAININLLGTIHLIQQFVKQTIGFNYKKKIIVIGSMAYNHVLNASAPYCASKAGLNHFIECIAWELAPKGYDVYIINPSNTQDTPMTKKTISGIMRYRNVDRKAAEAYWGAVLPKDKWLQKSDIAELVQYLLEDKNGYLSGSHLDLKGGQR